MTKFVVVNEAPAEVPKGEVVINFPNFMEQIELNARKAPRHKQTAVNHLREILNSIAEKYDHDMNPMGIKLVNYLGLPFQTNEDISKLMVRILKNEYPAIFDKALAYEIAKRPMNTKLVYFVGDFTQTKAFYEAGLDLIEHKDVEHYLSGKPKKTVGKPAVTNE